MASPQFQRVYRQGRKVVGQAVVAWIAPVPEGIVTSRLGLSVSRRVGPSVARNRVKRVLREAFRRAAPHLEAPLDLVLIARPGRAPTSLDEARKAVDDALTRWARPQRPRPPRTRS